MQWQSEHEEEVRALGQRNNQLQGQIEDMRIQFQEIISEQENQVIKMISTFYNIH